MKKNKLKFVVTVGTRPDIIKLFPLVTELRNREHEVYIVHTGQHYDKNMSEDFLKEFNMTPNMLHPSFDAFKIKGQLLYDILKNKKGFDYSIVQGDTDTCMLASVFSKKAHMKLIHLEAGLRSFDNSMPEEINRILVDNISDILFCPDNIDMCNILSEEIKGKAYIVGNTISDSVQYFKNYLDDNRQSKNYMVATMHRPSNVDNVEMLKNQLNNLSKLSNDTKLPILFYCHPRTAKMIENNKIKINKNITLSIPISDYKCMLSILQNAKYVITDSGGLQEECTILGTPCIVMRNNTERIQTCNVGACVLVGSDYNKIKKAVMYFNTINERWNNPMGNNVSTQIVDILEKEIKGEKQ